MVEVLGDLWLNLCNLQLAGNPIREIPGPAFLIGYVIGMIALPFVMGRQPAGIVLLLIGGYKAFLGFQHGKPTCFLLILLGVTVFTHLATYEGHGSGSGGCSGGGFFFFGGGGCGSSCGGGCGSSCGGGCGGGCGGCG